MGFGKLQMEDSIQSGIRSQISGSNPMGVVKCASVGQAWIDTWKFQIEDFNRWLRSGRLKIEGKRYNYNYKYKYRLAEKQIQSEISGSNPMVVVKCASAGQVWILQSYKLKIQIGIYISRPKSNPMDVVKCARARSDDHTLKGWKPMRRHPYQKHKVEIPWINRTISLKTN